MCRNIRVLHHFEPPTTPEEVRLAARQYVRQVSGARASRLSWTDKALLSGSGMCDNARSAKMVSPERTGPEQSEG